MSTEPVSRRARTRRGRGKAFAASFAIVLAVLAVVGAGAAVASVAQGPRVTDVKVDPAAAVEASGSRLIVTTTQSLATVDPRQVTVEPAVPFTVDTSGRSVGVRFGMPLHDATDYTVTISGLEGIGGGPEATVVETFATPEAQIRLLQRHGDGDDGDGDTIFRTDLSGEAAVPVFTHDHIEDFRATASHLVISVRTDDDAAALIVTDLDGQDARELPLPGDGFVSNLQAADRGEVIGYTFSDADLSEAGGLESVLFTASLAQHAADAPPVAIEVEGADWRVAEWRFVPDTDSILLLGFDGNLLLTGSAGGSATSLGSAIAIAGVAGTDAYVDRFEGAVVVDLTDASEAPLAQPDDEPGRMNGLTPVPGGGTLRSYARLDAAGLPTAGTVVVFVDDDGTARDVASVDAADAVLETCVSPNARYAAILVAPDVVSDPYDDYLLPLPERLETRIVELDDGSPVVQLTGLDVSWCRIPPS